MNLGVICLEAKRTTEISEGEYVAGRGRKALEKAEGKEPAREAEKVWL